MDDQIEEQKLKIAQFEESTKLVRAEINNLTNISEDGSIDRRQQQMSAEIVKLQSQVADLHIKLKNTKPKVTQTQ